jgi:mannose-6-phosphate isomerase-like protein (cupin superfamily)
MTTIKYDTTTTPTARAFKYTKPEFKSGHPTSVISLARTTRMWARMQVHSKGGEIGLHAHKHLDGFWMVIKGRARFYTDGDVVIADAGPMEGVLLPRGYKYRFEKIGDEDLEILQVESFDIDIPGDDSPADLIVDENYNYKKPIPTARFDARLPAS